MFKSADLSYSCKPGFRFTFVSFFLFQVGTAVRRDLENIIASDNSLVDSIVDDDSVGCCFYD